MLTLVQHTNDSVTFSLIPFPNPDVNHLIWTSIMFSVVRQAYEPRVIDEYVLRGNPVIVKCLIPSFVADYVQVVEWVTDDKESLSAFSTNNSDVNYGNRERPRDPNCSYPLHQHAPQNRQCDLFAALHLVFCFSAVNQFYESQVYDMYVIRGNAAVFKCHIPSFVSDHVQVVSWHDTEGGEYLPNTDYGILGNSLCRLDLILAYSPDKLFDTLLQY